MPNLREISLFAKTIPCRIINLFLQFLGRPPSVACWLESNPTIANSIKWQTTFMLSAYDVPEAAKVKYPDWTDAQKIELQEAFDDAWNWHKQRNPFRRFTETIAYPPTNISETLATDTASPGVKVDEAYARDLYIRWIATNLVAEIGQHFPWSITTLSPEGLQVLFDSCAMMTRDPLNRFSICAGSPGHSNYVKRKDNLGGSLLAPPRYTYSFLRINSLIGATRLETITKVLQWVSDNLVHFYGASNYINMQAHWQYRGIPPITAVIEGTTSTATTPPEFRHWTAGCHGTVGFLRNVLRAANIPVQIIIICGHGLAFFMTEGLYLDHGDDPYNLIFKASGHTAGELLIDQATYTAWFGTNPDNHEDTMSCSNIGHQVDVLSGP